jgi:3-oxoacyl-[acyl-carrier-protein] synthase-3
VTASPPEGAGTPAVALAATTHRLPERVMTAEEIAARSDIPAEVIIERFGIREKHIAAPDEHVSDMATAVGAALLHERDVDPASLDVVCYYGSSYKDYPVWQVAPLVAHRLGAHRAFALELDYVSCGGTVALRVCRDMMVAEPDLERVLLVGAARESALLDYGNRRARFMVNFGDGAAAALLTRNQGGLQVLASAGVTDGSLSLQVKVPVGGSVIPWQEGEPPPSLDVDDPAAMKERLDAVSMDNFTAVARDALRKSGLEHAPISLLCPLHMKRSMHEALCAALGVPDERAVYLDDTGHMSGVDTILGLDRAVRAGKVAAGDVVLLLAAGTGYTWAATVLQWRRP